MFYFETVLEDSCGVKHCSLTDHALDIPLSMILNCHFSYSYQDYNGNYYYSPTHLSVDVGYGASAKLDFWYW